ncbi:hypothetical protein TOPH_05372 [Tolypocladium ophioglossoides CBS 100239]|uniref:gamma-glutamylcyclotransferase n=1 Tax=Tolypocladium ophioglossoides (strain CBS 100239) TaxID=1163406 RepID=A0A0L0N8B9_TOLOC|nr:hypothetical protein TOPH_05372 [Tolypocladium ophioglossoides CBS 100239]
MSPHASLDAGPSVASAALDKAEVSRRHPRRGSYPPVSSLPFTSSQRLAQAAEDATTGPGEEASATVLYLAYGSNLSAETFLGVRGIRPLSQVNVSVPTLRLTFDLPGVPYREPCFANVSFMKLPEVPKLPDPTKPPKLPPQLPPLDPSQPGYEWDGRLMGVVYEVTLKDWRTIMRTEGAGSSYKEIVVPCIPIKPRISVPEKPAFPGLPRPFLARTLYASYIPDKGDDDPRKRKWWHRLASGRQRPSPGYAQASARYLKLLKDGAREHELPESYQKYLASLQPYTITHRRQMIGQVVFLGAWAPLLIFFLTMTNFLADETGKLPRWLAGGVAGMFNLMWMSYDAMFKPVFGDGERTEDGDEKLEERDGEDEEKVSLLANGTG